MSIYFHYVLFVIFVLQSTASCMSMNESMAYLNHFGYMENRSMPEAIKMFQRQGGVPRTGELDEDTRKAMEMPRCAIEDGDASRGPYANNKWKNGNFSYKIVNYPANLPRSGVDRAIADAFNQWSKIIGRWFRKKKFNADLNITFSRFQKVPGISMDAIAARARYPIDFGHIFFNANLNWTLDNKSNNGVNLYQIALHEIGHSIGLYHSSYRSSIMAPILDPGLGSSIHPSDIRKARELYEIDIPQEQLFEKRPSNETAPICTMKGMDAIVVYPANTDYNIFVFEGYRYWLLDSWTQEVLFNFDDYPRNITLRWKNLPTPVDTAFVDFENNTYFLKGPLCWKYLFGEGTPVLGYPKSISEEFPGIPDDIDAATAYDSDIIYFFKGREYWKFSINENTHVAQKYPQPIRRWNIDVNKLDAALFFTQYNEEMYFFKDMLYARYQENSITQFTRDIRFDWFNC